MAYLRGTGGAKGFATRVVEFPPGDLPDYGETTGRRRRKMPDEVCDEVLRRTTPGPAWWRLLRELAGDRPALDAIRNSCDLSAEADFNVERRELIRSAVRFVMRHRLRDETWAAIAWRAGISPERYFTELFRRAGIDSPPESWFRKKIRIGQIPNVEKRETTRYMQLLPSWSKTLNQALVQAAVNRPEIVRQHLGSEEKIRLYCDRVWKGVERDDPEAMKLFPKLLGLIGGGQEVDEAIKRLLGVKNLVEALRKLQIAEEAERVGSDEDAEREALRWINERRRMRGEVPYPDIYPAHEAEVVG